MHEKAAVSAQSESIAESKGAVAGGQKRKRKGGRLRGG